MKPIQSIRDVAANYDAFIIDLWGVMHDGSALYSGAKEAIAFLHAQGKQVIFLSNAPRRKDKPLATLLEMGILPEQFVDIVTSGQVAYDQIHAQKLFGSHYYYLGPSKDEDILDGLAGYAQVSAPEKADFILNTGFEYDYQPEVEIEPVLRALAAENLPLLCVNPDLEVVKQDGTRLLCAGWAARRYEQLGGAAHYVGKPHKAVYDMCFEKLGGKDKVSGRVSAERTPKRLAIGDNLLTDILGANRAGIDSLLITGGILTSEHGKPPAPEKLTDLCKKAGAAPTYVAQLFAV